MSAAKITPDDLLRCFPALNTASQEDLAYLLETAGCDEIPEGDRLIHSGQTSDCLFMIYSGSVRITLVKDDESQVLGDCGRGQWIGEMGMIAPAVAVAEVTATSDCVVLRISHDAFLALRRKRPALTSILLHLFSLDLTRRLRTTIEFIDRKSETRTST